MPETMKVNVTFQLVVPIRKDTAGRRLSIMDQVSPYISDYFQDLHTAMRVEKHHNYGPCKRCDVFNYDAQTDLDIFEKMGKVNFAERERQMEENRLRWEAQKDLECRDLYDMGWKDFKALKWDDQNKLRKDHGVVWENGGWVKSNAEHTIRINGLERKVKQKEISYAEIVELSGSKRIALHSVTYYTKGGQRQGILQPGAKVALGPNMIFDAVVTDNA